VKKVWEKKKKRRKGTIQRVNCGGRSRESIGGAFSGSCKTLLENQSRQTELIVEQEISLGITSGERAEKIRPFAEKHWGMEEMP